MEIGRKLYYDLATGNPIKLRESRNGSCVDTTTEEDFAVYPELHECIPSTVGEIQFEFGQYKSEFAEYLYHVDITQAPHVIAWDAAIVQTSPQPTDATLQISTPPLADSVSRPKTTKNTTTSKN
jgi:hypothetical protein